MTTPEITKPELLLSVARVARLMRVSNECVRFEVRRNRLRAEAVLIGDKLGVAVPLSAVAGRWNLSAARIRQVESEARPCGIDSAIPIISPLVRSKRGVGEPIKQGTGHARGTEHRSDCSLHSRSSLLCAALGVSITCASTCLALLYWNPAGRWARRAGPKQASNDD